MDFKIDASGAQAAGQGIGNLLKAYVMGPMYRQQAQREEEGKLADTYYRNMMGNQAGANARKYEQEAEGQRLTNRARTAPIDANLSRYLQDAMRLFQMTGDTNMERFANAGTAIQTQGIRDQALESVDDLDRMNRLNTLAKPGEAYLPFSAVGNTGYSVNQATGDIDGALRKLFGDKTNSEIAENNAQASKYSAEAALEVARKLFLNENGMLPGSSGGGVDATNAKARNAVIAAIEREMPGLSEEEFAAEVAKRMARREPNKNPAAASTDPKMGASIPAGYKQIGTSNGKPVYEGPDGKRYIME